MIIEYILQSSVSLYVVLDLWRSLAVRRRRFDWFRVMFDFFSDTQIRIPYFHNGSSKACTREVWCEWRVWSFFRRKRSSTRLLWFHEIILMWVWGLQVSISRSNIMPKYSVVIDMGVCMLSKVIERQLHLRRVEGRQTDFVWNSFSRLNYLGVILEPQ